VALTTLLSFTDSLRRKLLHPHFTYPPHRLHRFNHYKMASENYQHMQGSPPALSRLEQLIYEEPLHQMRLQELANQQANTVQELTQQNVQEVQGLTNQLNHTKAQCNRYAACMQEFIEKADRLEQEKDALKSQISQQRKEHNALLDSTRRDADAKLRDAQSLIKQHEDRAKVLQAQLDSMIGHIGMMDRFTRQQDSTLATSNKGVGSKRTRGAAEMQ
jgi:chromosome segregation ATPase